MDDLDVWRAANEMIKFFGADAQFKAALRADKLLDLGDSEGFNAWKRVATAIGNLTNGRSPGDTLH